MLKASEIKSILNHVMKNNDYLTSLGKQKTTLCIEGEAGIGKTSVIEQVARENNLGFHKITLSQIDQVGDLLGFPQKEFLTKEYGWLNEREIESHEKVTLTGESRTGYCQPAWVPQENDKGVLLLLDDFSRAAPHIIQSTMELLDRGEFISWKLPKNCNIVLSQNPEDGDYFVSSMDEAQKTRYIKVDMKFDVNEWATWAERDGVDSRCINFLLLNPEMIDKKKTVNARIATKFFDSISSISDFDSPESLYLINNLGSGSVGDEFTNAFLMFINNKLDRIPSPNMIFDQEKDSGAISLISDCTGDKTDDNYRQNIASVICTRLINFTNASSAKPKFSAKNFVGRLDAIITSEVFSDDINYHLVKTLNANNKMSGLLNNPKIAKIAIK